MALSLELNREVCSKDMTTHWLKTDSETDNLFGFNHRTSIYDKNKYEQNSEERGSQLQKNESGSQAVSDEGEIHDVRHLSMEVIETQHRLDRLEFYEKNNLELLEELEQKDLEYHLSIKHHKEELNSLTNYFQEQLTTLKSSYELKLSQMKLSERKAASPDQEQLQEAQRMEIPSKAIRRQNKTPRKQW